jgi:tRNA(Ile)-lysidine synthetase-like protein
MTLLEYWFTNEHVWFDATDCDDAIITKLFKQELDILKVPNLAACSKNQLLYLIILLDQIPRHVYREKTAQNLQIISNYHTQALNISTHILNQKLDCKYIDKARCFILLPLRHTFSIPYLNIVLGKLREYMQTNQQSKYYNRFFKATMYAISPIITSTIQIEEFDENITNDHIFAILDNNSCHAINPTPHLVKEKTFYPAFHQTLSKLNSKTIVISISGGVDSMVSSYILSQLAKKNRLYIIAVMINYNNRDESIIEVEFVKRWCKIINIDLYVRHIDNYKRVKDDSRSDYEKITRKIRFDMYRRFRSPIVLGHNMDDCVENIFTNLRKGRLANLRGMTEFVTDSECLLVRPMLNIKKSDIIKFAQEHQIPYLQDSTPKWSDRGKMRDVLIPNINSFDPNIITGLLLLADTTMKTNTIIDSSVFVPFYDNRIETENKIIFVKGNSLTYGYAFWKKVFQTTLVNYEKKPSNKSIKTCVILMEKGVKNIKLDENYSVKIGDTISIIIKKTNTNTN